MKEDYETVCPNLFNSKEINETELKEVSIGPIEITKDSEDPKPGILPKIFDFLKFVGKQNQEFMNRTRSIDFCWLYRPRKLGHGH
jgi:hypothetical protein